MATAPVANTSATGGGRYFFRGKPNPQIVSRTPAAAGADFGLLIANLIRYSGVSRA